MIRTDIRALIDSMYRLIAHSRLRKKSQKISDSSQKKIDDETAKLFEQHLAQRKRNVPQPERSMARSVSRSVKPRRMKLPRDLVGWFAALEIVVTLGFIAFALLRTR